jgi:hypothetical protein
VVGEEKGEGQAGTGQQQRLEIPASIAVREAVAAAGAAALAAEARCVDLAAAARMAEAIATAARTAAGAAAAAAFQAETAASGSGANEAMRDAVVRLAQGAERANAEARRLSLAASEAMDQAGSAAAEAGEAGAAAAAAVAASQSEGPSPGRGHERGTICSSANWIDPRSDKPRANLLCAFTGGRDEGVALLTNELERRGLSGLIRCPQSAIQGKTYDDGGTRRAMSIHKVFTLDDHLKEALWPPGSGGEQEMGGLTVFRSGYAAGEAELANRRRWARHLRRNGSECVEPVQMRTAAAAWMAAWNQLAAIGIPPGVVTKGAYCRRVAEGSAQDFRAIWAFSQPPAPNSDKFRKLSDAEATQIARERWGVDGTEVGCRPDRELVLHRGDESKKRAPDLSGAIVQPNRSRTEVDYMRILEARLASLESAAATTAALARDTALAQVQDREAARRAAEASTAAVATAMERIQTMMTDQAKQQQDLMAIQAQQQKEMMLQAFNQHMLAAVAQLQLPLAGDEGVEHSAAASAPADGSGTTSFTRGAAGQRGPG